ncbi:MAG TPA: hypothetical protein VGA37_12600 [Gemmatimonadales bacterium]
MRAGRGAQRRGVALLVVLWVIAAAGTVTSAGLGSFRQGVLAAEYRVHAVRARWEAEGCLALARAHAERALRAGSERHWVELPTALGIPGCGLQVIAAATGPFDLNTASAKQLGTLPGFTPDVVTSVLASRSWGRPLSGLDDLLSRLPGPSAERMRDSYDALAERVVFEPAAWEVSVVALVRSREVEIIRERWARAGGRVAVVRRVIP